jgi:hypothetical protein
MSYNVINFLDDIGNLAEKSVDEIRAYLDTHLYFQSHGVIPLYFLPLRQGDKVYRSDNIETISKKTSKEINFLLRTLYRARKIFSKQDINNLKISDFKYPPSNLSRFQRANRENSPIFYCSDLEIGAIQELNLIEGDEAIIGQWETQSPFGVFNLGRTHFLSKQKRLVLSDSSEEQVKKLETTEYELFNELLGQLFTTKITPNKNEYLYKLSTAITEKLLNSKLTNSPKFPIGGIIYPSSKYTPKKVDNLALTPACVDNHLKLVRFEHIRVIKINSHDNISVERLNFGVELDHNDKAIWLNTSDIREFSYYSHNQNEQRISFRRGDNFLMMINT